MEVTVYIQVKPKWSTYDPDNPRVIGVTLGRVTASRPRRPEPGTILTKLTLDVPESAFSPFAPEARVELSKGATEPIIVIAEDPRETNDDD